MLGQAHIFMYELQKMKHEGVVWEIGGQVKRGCHKQWVSGLGSIVAVSVQEQSRT